MGGASQIPPLVYHTLRSQAILAPYGVQAEDPPQEARAEKGKVAEEYNKSQSWQDHLDGESSHSTHSKRKSHRVTEELEESVPSKRDHSRRGHTSRKTKTPPRVNRSPHEARRVPDDERNPSAHQRLNFDHSKENDRRYIEEMRTIRDDIRRMERGRHEMQGSMRLPSSHHGPFTEVISLKIRAYKKKEGTNLASRAIIDRIITEYYKAFRNSSQNRFTMVTAILVHY
ncbi:hypothetical protein LWI29_031684 [Acer saccharum]|uniref:Uncharacterized protein n=1 Tax=Acer saccharum TaxID=4024 RepID=A0AA39REK7_ACESA|nr:hypothetical protein LWI29_031684 [Acer saccharum]